MTDIDLREEFIRQTIENVQRRGEEIQIKKGNGFALDFRDSSALIQLNLLNKDPESFARATGRLYDQANHPPEDFSNAQRNTMHKPGHSNKL